MNSNHHFHLRTDDEMRISSSDIGMDTIVFRINEITFYVPSSRALEFVHAVASDWSETVKGYLDSQQTV